MTKDEALKLALEALESCDQVYGSEGSYQYFSQSMVDKAITAIKQALALDKMAENARELGLDYEPYKGMSEHITQATNGRVCIDPVTGDVGIGSPPAQPAPVQEPVGVFVEDDDIGHVRLIPHQQMKLKDGDKLYNTPPAAQRQWVGLTDEERMDCIFATNWSKTPLRDTAKLIEAKLKEKNSG